MRTIKINLYEYNELNEEAQEKAREWWRSGALDYEWWQDMYDDAENIGLKITEFNEHECKGDFTIVSANTAANEILINHGKDCTTTKTAKEFYSNRRIINSTRFNNGDERDNANENNQHEFLQSLLEDYRIMLQNEYDYLLSDESAIESIQCNEYEFLESGERA